jgi:single-strand selective monofunctional uracil DNA glycosylase
MSAKPNRTADSLITTSATLSHALGGLHFSSPVTHVYNPLDYARWSHEMYLTKYGAGPKEIVLVGMNPGPWGMAQTGVPFGSVTMVRDWMGISAPVGNPPSPHPKRPVVGFECERNEVSGMRLWGWAREAYGTPTAFFRRFFVANYCPLAFFDEAGKNVTPDKLRRQDRESLFDVCDRALAQTVTALKPRLVVGIGVFAENRCRDALSDLDIEIGRITHPSPANPKANRGWAKVAGEEFKALGIEV